MFTIDAKLALHSAMLRANDSPFSLLGQAAREFEIFDSTVLNYLAQYI